MINDDIFYDCRKISPEQKQLIDKEESRRNNNGNCTKNVVVSKSNIVLLVYSCLPCIRMRILYIY